MRLLTKLTALSAIALLSLALSGCNKNPEIAPLTSDELNAAVPPGVLPDHATPETYHWSLEVDPREERFSAELAIDIQLHERVRGLWMHGNGIDVTKAELITNKFVGPVTYQQINETGSVWIDFGRVVNPQDIVLKFEYSAPFDTQLSGFFKVESQGDSFALAKSESTQARKFLIGYDEPGYKAVFNMTVAAPTGYHVITASPQIKAEQQGDMTIHTFAPTRPTSSYLLSLSVGPFEMVDAGQLEPNEYRDYAVPVRAFARPGKGKELKEIIELTAPMVAAFETSLKQPYPYKKLDIVAAPAWPSGATELASAPTYRESRILLGENPSPGARLAMQSIHAHEIAHMWFGNLVTPPWWDDLWLKEGFATWGTPMSLTMIYPEDGHELNGSDRALRAMATDSLASARAIREPIHHDATIRSAYDAITYNKSLAVIHMIDQYFGPEKFRPALGKYVAEFADADADSEDFFKVIAQYTGEPDLEHSFKSFVMQNGLPQLDAELRCTNSQPRVLLKQSRYAPIGSKIDKSRTWSIPVCVAYDGGRDCTLMTEKTTTLNLSTNQCPASIMPNAGGAGYYRFVVDDSNWAKLADNLQTMPATEAMAVVDSAIGAAKANIDLVEPVKPVLRAALNHPVRQIATQPFSALNFQLTYLTPQPLIEAARLSLIDRLQPRVNEQWQSLTGDDLLYQYQLTTFMVSTLHHPALSTKLADLADQYLKGNESALPSDLYSAAVLAAVHLDKEQFVKRLISELPNIDETRFRLAASASLGAASERYLSDLQTLALSEPLGGREASGLINGMMKNADVREQQWQWIIANLDAIKAKLPAQWVGRIPQMGSALCTAQELASYDQIFDAWSNEHPQGLRAYKETREKIGLCIAARKANNIEEQ